MNQASRLVSELSRGRTSRGVLLITFLFVACPAASGQDLSGIWTGRITVEQSGTSDVELILNQAGRNLSGTLVWNERQLGRVQLVINAGVVDSGRVVLTAQSQLAGGDLQFRFDGQAEGDSIKGPVEVNIGTVMGRGTLKGTMEVYRGSAGISAEPGETPSLSPSHVLCSDYAACMESLRKASNPREALAYLQQAATLEPSRSDAWYAMGLLYFQLGEYPKSWEMWDKALSLGGAASGEPPVAWVVCRERSFRPCEQGALGLSGNEVTLTKGREPSVEVIFSTPPSEVTSRPATLYSQASAAYLWLTVAGKNYRLYLIPFPPVQCQIDLAVICPEPGFTRQKVFANYVHHAIQALTSGELEPQPPPAPPVESHPVVPGGSIGQFRHGTLVTKLPSGSLVVAPTPQDATHTHAGLDIATEIGTAVYAIADGTVVDMIVSDRDKDFGSLGYMVIIKHTVPIDGRDTYSAYFHLNEPPALHVNQTVVGGQTQIGVVGKSGAATGPHLHLEVRHFGSRFFAHPEWNNIYGIGDQRNSSIFLENWENPETLGVPLI